MINVPVLEPAFYWRVQRDYDDAPTPTVVLFDPKTDTLETIRNKIIALTGSSNNRQSMTRIVLQACHFTHPSSPHPSLVLADIYQLTCPHYALIVYLDIPSTNLFPT